MLEHISKVHSDVSYIPTCPSRVHRVRDCSVDEPWMSSSAQIKSMLIAACVPLTYMCSFSFHFYVQARRIYKTRAHRAALVPPCNGHVTVILCKAAESAGMHSLSVRADVQRPACGTAQAGRHNGLAHLSPYPPPSHFPPPALPRIVTIASRLLRLAPRMSTATMAETVQAMAEDAFPTLPPAKDIPSTFVASMKSWCAIATNLDLPPC